MTPMLAMNRTAAAVGLAAPFDPIASVRLGRVGVVGGFPGDQLEESERT
jgi:hypothetical protein